MMRHGLRKLLMMQTVLAVGAALGMYAFRGTPAAVEAALYGGAIALVNTLLLARRTLRAAAIADKDARWSTFSLFAGMLERFLFTLVAFGLGMGMLRLGPPALIVGFAAAQLGFVLAKSKGFGEQTADTEFLHGKGKGSGT
ncbi:MAG: ATP synthase subunit I [Stenotrophobium sp.]